MSDGMEVDPGDLARAAAEFEALQGEAGRICSLADSADPNFPSMGLFGSLLQGIYSSTLTDAHHNLSLIREGLGRHAETLQATARQYGAADVANDKDFRAIGAGTPADPAGASVSAGPIDVLRFDANSDIPIASSIASFARSVAAAADDGVSQAEVGSLVAGIGDLGGTALLIHFDPLNYLISAGLGFLIDVVQPLQDLLDLITGNPEWTAAQAVVWRQVAADLRALAEAIAISGDSNLSTWRGEAANAARETLGRFAGGVTAAAQQVDTLAAALELLKSLMEAAESLVISLISAFVEWLILTWIAAILGEIPTLGGSTVAAALATEAEAGVAVSRGAAILDRVALLTQRLMNLLGKLKLRDLSKIYEDGFKGTRLVAGSHAPGFASVPRTLAKVGLDPKTVTGPAALKAGGNVLGYDGSTDAQPESDIEKALRGG